MNSAQDALRTASLADLLAYRAKTIPAEAAGLEFFRVENASEWVVPAMFAEFLRAKRVQTRTSVESTGPMNEVIEISSDDECSPPTVSRKRLASSPAKSATRKRSRKRAPTLPSECIVISDDDSSIPLPPASSSNAAPSLGVVKHEHERAIAPLPIDAIDCNANLKLEQMPASLSGPANSSPSPRLTTSELIASAVKDSHGRYTVSRKTHVDDIVLLPGVPTRWPVPPSDKKTAYVMDVSMDQHLAGKLSPSTNLDKLLKDEDQDSWGAGSNGSTSAPVPVQIIGKTECRRSTHNCNGTYRCEFFGDHLDGFERKNGDDLATTQAIFAAEQEQNDTDSATVLAKTTSFYRFIMSEKCKKPGCSGTFKMVPRKAGESAEGKSFFVGCTNWRSTEEYDHLYIAIPNPVDEQILLSLINNTPILSDSVSVYDNQPCASTRHPRHGKQKECSQ